MGRTTWREKADEATRIEISWLKKQGKIYNDNTAESASINWTHHPSESKSSICYLISTDDAGIKKIKLIYTITDRYSGEKKNIDYMVQFTTTPCNYGNVRYWFICPFYVGGIYCGRRVGILYLSGNYFCCRHCANLTYSSRCVSERMRLFDKLFRADEMREKIKTPYYQGKPSRRMRGYLRKCAKSL